MRLTWPIHQGMPATAMQPANRSAWITNRMVPIVTALVVVTCTALVLTPAAGVPALAATARRAVVPAAATGTPRIRLIAAQDSITVPIVQGQVDFDPGIWVASLGAALELRVQRAGYGAPVTVTQVIHLHGGRARFRRLPSWTVDGFDGLRGFLRVRIADSHGKTVVRQLMGVCPDSPDPQRAVPDSPITDPYPWTCAFDPFPLALVEGIARGWAVDPYSSYFNQATIVLLKPGSYQVTAQITSRFTRLMGISGPDAIARVRMRVVNASGCCVGQVPGSRPAAHGSRAARPLRSLPNAPLLTRIPRRDLPDLVALPAWGISSAQDGRRDLLVFNATVWAGGSPLDVEGFRHDGSPVMQAYQYFWHDGRIIGRVPAGTMGFDRRSGHNHWHFEQFARYQLLNASRTLAVRSHKQGFCIAPSDPVDLLLPGAVWQPSVIGLLGQCGVPTALWVQEYLPIGWGDTYTQAVAGQAFDITTLPDGTYYIEVIANPEHLLREQDLGNDISLRKIILGGSPGHRTVKVPAWHGIDPGL
jgi:Lysyl oxidase